jgi:hypothetical protein
MYMYSFVNNYVEGGALGFWNELVLGLLHIVRPAMMDWCWVRLEISHRYIVENITISR